jgi:hypothetical protein
MLHGSIVPNYLRIVNERRVLAVCRRGQIRNPISWFTGANRIVNGQKTGFSESLRVGQSFARRGVVACALLKLWLAIVAAARNLVTSARLGAIQRAIRLFDQFVHRFGGLGHRGNSLASRRRRNGIAVTIGKLD